MRILLAILKLCGNRLDKFEHAVKKEKSKKMSFDEKMTKYVRDPTTRPMNLWFIFLSVVYYIGIIQDSLQLANMFFILIPGWRLLTITRAFLMLIDIVTKFVIAIPKNAKDVRSQNDNFEDK